MSKWDFTEQGRLTQAQRIRHIADGVVEAGRVAVADFVCPTVETRKYLVQTLLFGWTLQRK